MRTGRSLRLLVLAVCLATLGVACTTSDGGGGGSDGGGGQPTQGVQATGPTGTAPTGPTGTTAQPEPVSGLGGTWSGTWANSTPDDATGTFEIAWTQDGTKLSGTITIDGTPCLSGGTITGKIRGNAINFGVVEGQVEVNYAGEVEGDTMSGTYATSCGNANGDWEATKTG